MYLDKIQEERQAAQDANTANKIIDMMERLHMSANENSPRRWIWELLQNAKDVSNTTGKVKVKVDLNEGKGYLKFSHNGKAFTRKNIVYLIEQVSTKDRSKEGISTTGKFGTGFLTTHLLSEVVNVSGYLEDIDEPLRHFLITLDRSGKDKETIIKAIKNSYMQLNNSNVVEEEKYSEAAYNTSFIYELNEKGIEVAQKGIEDLKISIPYVLAFTKEIEEVYIQSEDIKYKVVEKFSDSTQEYEIYEIQEIQLLKTYSYYILVFREEKVSVAISIENKGNSTSINKFSKKQPKIFCDFPLIGTDDFPFPIVVNSSLFNPTEPRDGIFLTDIDSEKIEENKNLIMDACKLYERLLYIVTQKNWKHIYNITHLGTIVRKEWYSVDWVKDSVVNTCKEYIKYCPIIETADGKRTALYNSNNEIQVEIPSDIKAEIREDIWELYSKWRPSQLPLKEEIHDWYDSLWSECRKLNIRKVTEELQEEESEWTLELELEEGVNVEYLLNEYYQLLETDAEILNAVVAGNYKVIPNQKGDFKKTTELFLDDQIDEKYKKVLLTLGEDCKEYLVGKNIRTTNLIRNEKISDNDIINKIEDMADRVEKDIQEKVYLSILTLYNEQNQLYDRQMKIIEFAERIYDNCLGKKEAVNSISDKLLQSAIKYTATRICNTISELTTIEQFSVKMAFVNKQEALEWMNQFVGYLSKMGFDNLLNKPTKPILPNQNGIFKTKDDLFLDDGEIDEGLKRISAETGYDIKEELLDRAILLELPDNRVKHVIDLSDNIIRFVKVNHVNVISLDNKVKDTFEDIYMWIDENTDLARKVLPELCEHIHWLYDDEKIANNIRKVKEYENLLEKYNIWDSKVLEDILKNGASSINERHEKECITDELLIQSGIYSDELLDNAMEDEFFSNNFIHESESSQLKFDFIKKILQRAKNNIFNFLQTNEKYKKEYDLSNCLEMDTVGKTTFLAKKNGKDIFLIVRPSDYGQVILYYDSEKDILDYEKDWELWVEDGKSEPQKITFGKILKLTGINKIPLKRIR